MDSHQNCPLKGAGSISPAHFYLFLKRELADKSMRQSCSMWIIFLRHYIEALIVDQFRELFTLAREHRTHFSNVMNPRKEYECCSGLLLIPFPDGCHQSSMMLT